VAAVVVGAGVVVVGAASPELVAEDRAEVSALFVVPPPHADRNSKQQTTPTANFMRLSVAEIHPKAKHSWFPIFQTLKATNPLCCYGRPMSEIRVEAIHIHPVKSCRRIEVDEASILSTGLAHDREWQIVDSEGSCVTQRTHPSLATIETALDGDDVILSASGRGSVTLSADDAAAVTVLPLVGKRPVNGVDGGDEAAAWISDFLGESHRLAAVTDDSKHRAPSSIDVFEQHITFVDLAPVLLANSASLRWLQERAVEPFGIERFRANIIVDAGEAWIEDSWHDLTIGAASLTAEVPWPRCAVPQIDQESGERQREPAVALRAYRWCSEAPTLEGNLKAMMEGNGLFGMACRVGPAGSTIKVGDLVEVQTFQDPIIAPPSNV
tara:strand:- start:15036 stop:16181 length:1146 start_codon:yes stop_codon:yes gene_type:complete